MELLKVAREMVILGRKIIPDNNPLTSQPLGDASFKKLDSVTPMGLATPGRSAKDTSWEHKEPTSSKGSMKIE